MKEIFESLNDSAQAKMLDYLAISYRMEILSRIADDAVVENLIRQLLDNLSVDEAHNIVKNLSNDYKSLEQYRENAKAQYELFLRLANKKGA